MTRENILLVDDDPMVRKIVASLLDELGFDVVEATTAETALAKLRQGGIDTILCDDSLGAGISGMDLITGNTALMPETVVLMSGNPKPDGLAHSARYLSKPFTIAQLEAALRPIEAQAPPSKAIEDDQTQHSVHR